MHLLIFLVILVSLFSAIKSSSEYFQGTINSILILSALYFGAWYALKKYAAVKPQYLSRLPKEIASVLEKISASSIYNVAAIFIAISAFAFALPALFNGHSIGASIIGGFGIGLASLIAEIGKKRSP